MARIGENLTFLKSIPGANGKKLILANSSDEELKTLVELIHNLHLVSTEKLTIKKAKVFSQYLKNKRKLKRSYLIKFFVQRQKELAGVVSCFILRGIEEGLLNYFSENDDSS